MSILTVRAVFDAATVLGLLDEPEFADNVTLQAARDVKRTSDHFFAVFVLSAEPHADGTQALRIISSTVVGIQRYTTTRLRHEGIHRTQPPASSLLMETLRAHYRAKQADMMEKLSHRAIRPPWTKYFPNGAGDLSDSPEFIIADPDLPDLEKLFSMPDPRPEPETGGVE